MWIQNAPRSASRPHTHRAFLLAPGIAALVGAASFAVFLMTLMPSSTVGESVGAAAFLLPFVAVVGYGITAVIAVPLHLLLPEKVPSASTLVPLAGLIAAAPFFLKVAPWRGGDVFLPGVLVPFGFGIVAGIAFIVLRRSS